MTEATTKLNTADIVRIQQLLPHRYPFLLVDRVIEINGDEFGIGIKNVTYNWTHIQGNFPSRPINPGVYLIEGMTQTASAICILSKFAHEGRPKPVYLATVDKAKFRRPVVPGDRIEYHMTKMNNRRNIWWYRGEARVDGSLVAEAELSAMMVDE